ncbi:MAG: discoidin domain-containing protein [Phycisphaerales bacterium]|nr:MAG: discoidin domain-containing protein [Phycisphaerales bacterium]
MSRKLILILTVLAGLIAGSALAEQIAYFPFSEGQGTDTVDATGNGNDGTLSAGVEWVAGQKGSGVHFDTAGERIVLNELDPSAAHNAMTLAAWINWEGLNHSIAQQGIIGKRQGWDPGTGIKWFWQAQPSGALLFRADWANGGGTGLWWGNTYLVPYANEWTHVALVWEDGAAIQYINGEEISTGNITFQDTADDTIVSIGCVSATNTETFVGTIDEVRIYDTALTATELQKAMTGDFKSSSAPGPPDGSTDIPQDVMLSWLPGDYAVAHDVYFGTNRADVDAADRSNPLGVLVSQGQTDLTYDPPGLLDFSQTYYWRVDEVNAAPDSSIFKGGVWSFTVEPFVYPIANVAATASHAEAGSEPVNTVNGSGLDADDLHGINAVDMWLASPGPDEPLWIQYEFDDVYKLSEMWVWNYNVQFELVLGFGLKDVTIEYSADGVGWTTFGDVEFAKATATTGYAHNTTVDLTGVSARYIRLNVNSGWGPMGQFGLSEVRFYYKPVVARDPQPAPAQEGVGVATTLDWRSGREAAAHELYFSSDRAAVADGTALVDTLTESRYQVEGLELGTTYYWKVNEVNDAAVPASWEGAIWTFSTQEFFVVEDFESYDDEDNRIYDTWLDGWVNDTGSVVGYLDAPFAERSIVNSGGQSMPLQYDNSSAPFYSEAEWDVGGANWTTGGADTLVVHFRGNAASTPDTPGNDPASVYLAVEDGAGRIQVVTFPDPQATTLTQWQSWEIPFSELGSLSLNNVDYLYIGVGDRDNPSAGGTGILYVDDILVGHPGSADPGASGLVAYYALENDVNDSSGNGYDGIVMGEPVYVDGPAGHGMALEFDGAGGQYVDLGTWNPSAATGQLTVSLWANWNGLSGQYQGLIAKRDTWAADDMMWQIEANVDTGALGFFRDGSAPPDGDPVLPVGGWAHVAATFDGTTAKFYFNGQMTGQGDFSFGSDPEAALVFGACQGDGGNPFNGALDEVRIYDRALSGFEVNYLAGQ